MKTRNFHGFSMMTGAFALVMAGVPLSAAPLPPVDCVITPNITVELSSPIPGALSEVLVDRSDQVESDQVVARMDSGVEEATVSLARERSTMQAEVKLERVNLEYDQREQKRLSSLYGNNLVAEKALDDAERSYALTNWKIQQARDLVRLRVLELKRAEELLEQKWIRSPIDGVVIQRYKQPGEYVEDQAILQIAQLDVLAVEAIVPMQLFYSIEKGMAADIYAETAPSLAIRAHVSVVDQMGDASSGTFGVRLTLPNQDMSVPAGVKCTVQFLPDLPLMAAINTPDPVPEPEVASAPLSTSDPLAESSPEPLSEMRPEAIPETSESAEAVEVTEPGNTGEASIAALPEAGGNDWPPSSSAVENPPLLDACTSLGPIPEREDADLLLKRFNSRGLPGRLRSAREVVGSGYSVHSLPGITRDESERIQKILDEHGIEDVLQVGKVRLVFGFFSTAERAERRRLQLADLDVETRVIDKVLNAEQWWLDIDVELADGGQTSHEELLAEAGDSGQLRTESCQPRMAER